MKTRVLTIIFILSTLASFQAQAKKVKITYRNAPTTEEVMEVTKTIIPAQWENFSQKWKESVAKKFQKWCPMWGNCSEEFFEKFAYRETAGNLMVLRPSYLVPMLDDEGLDSLQGILRCGIVTESGEVNRSIVCKHLLKEIEIRSTIQTGGDCYKNDESIDHEKSL